MLDSFAYAYSSAEHQIAIHTLPRSAAQSLIPLDVFAVYGDVLKKYCPCCINENTWTIPYREGLQSFTIRFDALDVTEDELRLIKAYIVDTLSHYSSPSTCTNRVKNLAFLFAFLHQQNLNITMLSSPVIRMYRLWLDKQKTLSDRKKNDLESTLKSFVPFLRQLHLLRPGNIVIPKPRMVPKSNLVRAPENSILRKLDQFFFDFDNPVPSDFRCAYIIARMIPARDAEVFSLPLDCFSIHGELVTIRFPTFKETPNHMPVYQEHYRFVQPFPECALVRALQEQHTYAQSHQSDILSAAQKNRLMVSSRTPRRLTQADEFNRYLQLICMELNITDHTGAPAHVSMYSLRHAIGAAMSADADIPSAEFTRAFSHTNQASDCGYGYSSQYDELQRTAPATSNVRNYLTEKASTNCNPRIVLPGKMSKIQFDPQSQLIGMHSACHQRNCKPQLSSCVHCDSFIPDPRFIPAAKECCKILNKRIEQCQKTEILRYWNSISSNYRHTKHLSLVLKIRKQPKEANKMAGRPIDPVIREARKKEVDEAIALLMSRGRPATRKNIAFEIGMAVQNLYGSGYLSVYIKELENSGIVCSEESLKPQLSSAEVKHLLKENKRLQAENEQLRKRYERACETLAQKSQEIQELSNQLLVVKGELFQQRQHNFAKSRI